MTVWLYSRILLTGLLINCLGGALAPHLSGVLFLDMAGTALVAMLAGPWWGALIGGITNYLLSFLPGLTQYWDYSIVNVIGGVVWGYIYRAPVLNDMPRLNNRRLLTELLVVGIFSGLVISTAANLVRIEWSLFLDATHIQHLRERHLTDSIVKIALKNGWIEDGTIFIKLVAFEFVSIFPDKILSVAVATFVSFYWFPCVFDNRSITLRSDKAPQFLGVILVVPLLVAIARRFIVTNQSGNVFVFYTVMSILSIAVVSELWRLRVAHNGDKVKQLEQFVYNQNLNVEKVYQDSIWIVSLIYIGISTQKMGKKGGALEDLLENGMGVIAMLGLLGFVLPAVFRYLTPPRSRKLDRHSEL